MHPTPAMSLAFLSQAALNAATNFKTRAVDTARGLTLPVGIVLAAVVLTELNPTLDPWRPALSALPLALAGVVALTAARMGQARLVFAALLIAATQAAPAMQGAVAALGGAGDASAVHAALGLLVPLNLAAVTLVGDRGLLSHWGQWQFLALGFQATLAALLLSDGVGLAAPGSGSAALMALPGSAGMTASALAVGLPLAQLVRGGSPVTAGLACAAMALVAALGAAPGSNQALLYASSAGAALLAALILDAHRLAYLDELTDLPTRRALKAEFRKLSGDYTVAMVDVDHFKKFNDTYGHDVGDQVLRMVAARLRKVSGGGRAFRYGGEEFTVLFAGKGRTEAKAHLERLRADIEAAGFTLRGSDRPKRKPQRTAKSTRAKRVGVTVSIGIAQRDARAPSPEAVVTAADKALYKAKRQGRNRLALG